MTVRSRFDRSKSEAVALAEAPGYSQATFGLGFWCGAKRFAKLASCYQSGLARIDLGPLLVQSLGRNFHNRPQCLGE